VNFDSPGDVTGRVEGLNNLKSESSGRSRPVCDGPTLEAGCRMEWTGELDIFSSRQIDTYTFRQSQLELIFAKR
jgi:hypothetical protein